MNCTKGGVTIGCLVTFMTRHNLDSSAVQSLLNLIQLHCPAEGLVKLSLFKLKKYFSFSPGPVNKHYYCSVCTQALPTQQAACQVCGQRRKVSYFIQNPIIPQLKKLFARTTFYVGLQNRYTRRRFSQHSLEDIYDGQVYKEQVRNGFLDNPNNLTITYFVDGVPVFKSQNYSFWGFYLTINELPYKERIKRENTLLAGVWLGRKPHANLFMSTFMADLQQIHDGVNIFVAGLQQRIIVRGIVIAGVADTPARSTFMNCKHHNATFGCVLCEIAGITVRLPSGTDTHAYRYQALLPKRNVQQVLQQARLAVERNDDVMGVKGPTALRLFMPDYLRGTGIDAMHLVQGIVKKFMKLWFDSKFSGNIYSLRDVLRVVDLFLLSFRPPKFIHRLPRTIDDWKHWKASEFCAWCFYYSPVILKEVMSPEYYNHYMKFDIALGFLNATSVSQQMIDKADQLLHEFVRDFEPLYGLERCSINVHMLLHLSDCVRELGPLFVYSCFSYENINGEILRDIHGKTNVDSQISRMHWQSLELPLRLLNLRDGPVKEFCTQHRGQLKISERLWQSCYMVGKYSDRNINDPLIAQGLQNSNVHFSQIKLFTRLLKDSFVYVSESYTRDLRSNSSCAAFQQGNMKSYSCIFIFVKTLKCECDFRCNCHGEYYAIIRGTEKVSDLRLLDHPNTSLHYMHSARMTLNVCAVPVQDLVGVCFLMNVNGKMYIAEPVNQSNIE